MKIYTERILNIERTDGFISQFKVGDHVVTFIDNTTIKGTIQEIKLDYIRINNKLYEIRLIENIKFR